MTYEIFYIGQEFYRNSGTKMSPFYRRFPKGRIERFSLGEIEEAVKDGFEVYIRPASPQEIAWAKKELTNILFDH